MTKENFYVCVLTAIYSAVFVYNYDIICYLIGLDSLTNGRMMRCSIFSQKVAHNVLDTPELLNSITSRVHQGAAVVTVYLSGLSFYLSGLHNTHSMIRLQFICTNFEPSCSGINIDALESERDL